MQKKYQLCACEPSIFRAYDIRGLVEQQLNANVYFTLGYAIGLILKSLNRSEILIAWDGRLTSKEYSEALSYGLIAQNIKVIHLGLMPTALMYYGTVVTDIDSGLMITGSHNPKNYNGLKMVLAGKTLAEDGVQEIFLTIQQLTVGQEINLPEQNIESLDVLSSYRDHILKDIKLQRPLKVIADYGNGMGATVGPQLFKELGCEIINLYDVVDGHFPAHHPDPTIPENLEYLKTALIQHKADIGIAFDGDADRLGVMSPKGEIIWPDRLMMVFAKEVLARKPNSTIVYDVKCSKQLNDVIEQAGGIAMMSPTGHSLVKGIMKKQQAELAGEMSGHIFFKDRWFGFDDGIYSACRFLEILSHYPCLDSLMDTLPKNPVVTPEIKIFIDEDKKFNFMKKLQAQTFPPAAKLIAIDGVRLEFEQGWGLIRASNTSPCLVSRFEADSYEALLHIQQIFKNMIYGIDASLAVPF